MLSKEDKLEMIALLGQAINQKGGLVVQGTMVGEGGTVVVNNPVEVIETTTRSSLVELIGDKIQAVNAGLPTAYDNTIEYRYVINQTTPMTSGIWREADVGNKVTFDKSPRLIRYCESTNEMFVNFSEEPAKLYIYDVDTWLVKNTIFSSIDIANFSVSIDANRVYIETGNGSYYRKGHVWNKQFGIYIYVQELTLGTGGQWYVGAYGASAINNKGDKIVAVGAYNYGGDLKSRLATYSLKFGRFTLSNTAPLTDTNFNYLGTRLSFSADDSKVYVVSREFEQDTQLHSVAVNSDKNYTVVENYQLPSTVASDHTTNVIMSMDERRALISKNGALYILAELNSIEQQIDPFKDNTMLAKYFFNDNTENFVNASIYPMEVIVATDNQVPYDIDANIGKAVNFDGATMLKIVSTTDLETQSMTWAFNLKLGGASTEDNYILAYIGVDYEAKSRGIKIAEKAGKIVVYHGSGDSSFEVVTDATDLVDGNYHHIAVVIANGGSINIYIDGALTTEQVVSPASISYLNSSSFVSVGGRAENSNSPAEYGVYKLNLPTFFNRALTATEVAAVATQRLRQQGRYEIEQAISVPNGGNDSWFGYGLATSSSLEKLWIGANEEKAIYLYTARRHNILIDTFSTNQGWTLDADTTVVDNQLVLNHTANDNSAVHSVNQLDISQYHLSLDYPVDASGDVTHKVKVLIGDTTTDIVFNEVGTTTVLIAIADVTDRTFKIFTDADCASLEYKIDTVKLVLA